ncbi:MAG: TlpA family protein disulfide reductase [Ignavibacteria bacterium]|jgi:thiol-disulfide isomerase/thioredoxin|nr:TlpA family protein disulfide reductase [Ignavibacteria bacterium]
MKKLTLTVFIFAFTLYFTTQMHCLANPSVSVGKVYEIVSAEKSETGKMVDFFFLDDNGEKVSIKSIAKNKFIFLNFWATWCPPCRAEIPAIIELQDELKSKDLMVIGIALEREKDIAKEKEKVQNYVANNKINYINFVTSQEIKKALADAYGGIPYIPTTFLIDKKYNVFEKIQGGREKKEFRESLDKMMK